MLRRTQRSWQWRYLLQWIGVIAPSSMLPSPGRADCAGAAWLLDAQANVRPTATAMAPSQGSNFFIGVLLSFQSVEPRLKRWPQQLTALRASLFAARLLLSSSESRSRKVSP